ncbi:PEPxxWA-CTERM sorting domain-containing protein [Sandaracinobacter sp. RS1-74]|nr:PEPxxWA-CTERM sorting domain-containing protein [Sandaracinobacteroides sayramensis]MCG2839413.1 PEPxxWA-CTERM sorting domain-containing protein [Sandaracinobacteroides sayramensis]
MRTRILAAAGASLLAISTQAEAATFVFNSGNYAPGVTAPEPLGLGDVLELNTSSNKLWMGVEMTNESGTVNWNGGHLYLGNGAQIRNQGLWNALSDNGIYNNGGALSTFNNSGIFRKSGGIGTTTINPAAFVNSGSIEALSGTIAFTGGNNSFNAGSSFSGAGAVHIASNSAFNGGFSSSNLVFTSGAFTGDNAVLNGSAEFRAGTFAGTWQIASGSTLAARTSTNKLLMGANFTNNGNFDWEGGHIYLGNGTEFVNNGTVRASSSAGIYNNGGAASTFTNGAAGKVRVEAGANVAVGNRFVNNGGTLDVDGTLGFNGGNAVFNDGTAFTGTGVTNIASSAAFNGGFSSSNLRFTSGTFTGADAVLNGDAQFHAGTFAGGWEIAAPSKLTAVSSTNKLLMGANFTNNGSFDWQGGHIYLGNGTQFVNNGVFAASTSNGLYNNGGAASVFTNNGQFNVNSGASVTVTNAFVNQGGAINAEGNLIFAGGNAVFNGGSLLGAGEINIASNAAFNGAFQSSNVNFTSGTFTGSDAVLNGAAEFRAGTFTGSWEVSEVSTLRALGSTNKLLMGANFTNNGSFDWQGGHIYLGNGTQFVNNGRIAVTTDSSALNNGGAASSFVNKGLIEKTGGAGTTTFASNIGFANEGVINVLSGTIALPTNFTNGGTLAGTGTFSVSGTLTNNGTVNPGDLGATGTLGLTGNYVQTDSGVFAAQLASSTAADLLNITGSATLGGILDISCILSCAISSGDSFVLLDSVGQLSGVFASVNTSGFLNGFLYDIVYDYGANRVLLQVVDAGSKLPGGVPEPATWAMLIAGFGMVGAAVRRRNAASTRV